MKETVIKIEQAEVDKLKRLDMTLQVEQATLAALYDNHIYDENAKLDEKAEVQRLRDRVVDAKVAFETAKDEVINKYIDKELQRDVTEWDINYSSAELTYKTR